MTDLTSSAASSSGAASRRTFLRVAGASAAGVGLVLAGCGDDGPTPATAPTVLSFGNDENTDRRVLNYLLFVKQLEFAFYDKVVNAFPADVPAAEQAMLRDLRDHELVQQQVLSNVLGTGAITRLPFDFASVTLTSRAGILGAAKLLEDTGSGAFLGILPRLNANSLFMLAAKMASVEARHAALVRDLLAPGTFADDDVLENSGLLAGQGKALTPTQVAGPKTTANPTGGVLTPFLPTLTINVDSLLAI